jgi:hypothetical protein
LRPRRSTDLARPGAVFSRGLLCLVVVLFALTFFSNAQGAAAVTPAQISSANSAIQSAFGSVQSAEKSGGNVTSLDASLNEAIQLVQKAAAENATDPAQAAADLQNATLIAQSVASESPSVGQAGGAARQSAETTSAGAVGAIIIVASLTFLFGGRVYRKAWLRLHRDYVVRPTNG